MENFFIPSLAKSKILEVLCDDSVLLCQSVDAVIGLAHSADGSADGIGLVRASHSSGRLVDVGEVELDRSVILCSDDSVTRGEVLARDVQIHELSSIVLHGCRIKCHVTDFQTA